MAKSKPQTVVETPVVETPVVETPVVETPVVETPAKKVKSDSIIIRYKNNIGETIDRVYSKSIHGDEFEELAKGFAEKKNGTIV